jgi:OmpA-OmpF porin, OOP family
MRAPLVLTFTLLAGSAHALELSAAAGYRKGDPKITEFDTVRLNVECEAATCKLKKYIKDGYLVIDGRIEETTVFHERGSQLSPSQVAREYISSLRKAGAELMNPEAESGGRFVFRLQEKGVTNWVVMKGNFKGYYTLVQVTAQDSRDSTVTIRASELAASLKAEGMATLYMEFDTGRSELKGEGPAMVDEISKLLKQQPALRLSVEGHTDNVGDAASNRQLSLARAQAVVVALRAKGVDAKRLAVKGHGPDIPIADNRKEAGRAKNRRVELLPLP